MRVVVVVVVIVEFTVLFVCCVDVDFAIDSFLSDAKLVARTENSVANDAPEALRVVNAVLGSHHQIVFLEFHPAQATSCAEESEERNVEWRSVGATLTVNDDSDVPYPYG